MIKTIRRCLDSIFWVFPLGFILMDWYALKLLLITLAHLSGTILMFEGICLFFDAVIGYENDAETALTPKERMIGGDTHVD